MKNIARFFLLSVLLGLTICLLQSGILHALTFESLQARHVELLTWTDQHRLLAVLYYFFIYVMVTAMALPGAAILTLAGGALFGLVVGTLIVSVASTLGATLCLLGSRLLFRDLVARKFKSPYDRVQNGLEKEGIFYLFTLRLIPQVPFFAINLVFGLTQMPAKTFAWVSQLGMLPVTLAFVNAGTQLRQVSSLSGILSGPVLLSLLLLAIVPWLAKLERFHSWRRG